MFYYAQLNEESICIGVSQLSGEVSNPTMIAIPSMDSSLVGIKHNDGKWEDVEQSKLQLSEMEQTQLELALNVEYLICLTELNE